MESLFIQLNLNKLTLMTGFVVHGLSLTNTYIHVYVYVYVCMCMYICVCVCVCILKTYKF